MYWRNTFEGSEEEMPGVGTCRSAVCERREERKAVGVGRASPCTAQLWHHPGQTEGSSRERLPVRRILRLQGMAELWYPTMRRQSLGYSPEGAWPVALRCGHWRLPATYIPLNRFSFWGTVWALFSRGCHNLEIPFLEYHGILIW